MLRDPLAAAQDTEPHLGLPVLVEVVNDDDRDIQLLAGGQLGAPLVNHQPHRGKRVGHVALELRLKRELLDVDEVVTRLTVGA